MLSIFYYFAFKSDQLINSLAAETPRTFLHTSGNGSILLQFLAIHTAPLDLSGPSTKTFDSVLFQVNQVAARGCVPGAAAITVAISAIIIDFSLNSSRSLRNSERLEPVHGAMVLVNGHDVIGPDPTLGLLSVQVGKVPGPLTTVVSDALVTVRIWVAFIPRQGGVDGSRVVSVAAVYYLGGCIADQGEKNYQKELHG